VGTFAEERAVYPGKPSGPTSGSLDEGRSFDDELKAYFDFDFRSADDGVGIEDEEDPREELDGRADGGLWGGFSDDLDGSEPFRSAVDVAFERGGEEPKERFRVRAERASERLLLMWSLYLSVSSLAHDPTSGVCEGRSEDMLDGGSLSGRDSSK
jgi:hypothetical protein